MTLLAVLFWALAAPAGAAEGPSFGAGTSFAAGTGRYWRLALSGDAQWTLPPWAPYGWAEFAADRYASHRFAFGGGTWHELDEDVRVKGGLSYAVGRYRDTDLGSHAVTLETGAERRFEGGTAGAEYLYTTGALGRSGGSVERNRGGQLRRTRSSAGPSFTDHTLAAYGRIPSGETTVGLRVALDVLSDDDDVLSETLSWKLPIAEETWLTPALTLEEGRDTAAILSLALYRTF
ncbi:hypothetical protein EPO15_14125 [bacterium]|nr:MAG: hypothetical protein EPO15_14125 [bacterium]